MMLVRFGLDPASSADEGGLEICLPCGSSLDRPSVGTLMQG